MYLRNSLTLCLLLGGCAVGPNYHAPDIKLPDQFSAKPAEIAESKNPAIDAAKWWISLGDDELNSLIDRAIAGNPHLDIALTHLQEARQQEAVAMGGALPEVEASASEARGSGSDLTKGRADAPLRSGDFTSGGKPVTQIYGLDAGWELDLFGQYRREMEAAGYNTQAAAAARNEVLISLIADVVGSYTDMRALQMRQAVLKQDIATLQQYAQVSKERFDRGITNELDVSLADRQLATLQAQVAPLDAQVQAAQNTIAALLGEFPEKLATELQKPGPFPALPQQLSIGVPVDLLRNRPDINQAERELASATAQVGVATANLFPHVTLTGSAGYQGIGTSPSTNFIWSAGPSIGMPLLDFGTLDALVNVADLNTHAKLMNYKQTVISAVTDVDNATSAYSAQQARLHNLDDALTASQQAVTLASKRYDRGLTDMLNVIDAQRQQFELEQQYITAQQTAAQQFIALYKALGSGWEQYQAIPPIPAPEPALIAALARTVE